MKPVYNDFTDIRKAQAARILSSYIETDIVLRANDEIKKAEGARGGRVVGHTKNGKPVYANKDASKYKDFTHQDHNDAAEIHNQLANEKRESGGDKHHQEMNLEHSQLASELAKKELDKYIKKDKAKTRDWFNDSKNDSGETKSFKHNYINATKEQRERVAENYFGDKNKDLREVGKHHHEQLSQALYEKMEADKKGKVEKAMSTSSTPGFETAEGKDGKIVGKPDKPKVGDVKVELEKSEDGDADGAQFDKAQSPEEKAKMEKVMKEFKEGTLKTSAGEKVTDHTQALAIAISESKSIKKGETMKVNTKEMIEEHKKLVNTLESPSHKDDKEEAKKQKKELKEYEGELKKAFEIVGL